MRVSRYFLDTHPPPLYYEKTEWKQRAVHEILEVTTPASGQSAQYRLIEFVEI
jgi:hypothetical protein